ncbi:MAG: FAD binding domain-containing protein [Deltaproteobacteria bacterium]|nr:FAD binding domain-containing protein [Deltaproteobacteria bacterium]
MRSFDHVNAGSIREAVELLGRHPGKAALMAGGTDLLTVLKDDILPAYPELVINLKTIPGLDTVEEDDKGLRIGAMARLAEIAASPPVRGGYGILAEAAASVGTPALRNMGTIGGNLCQDVRCWYYRYPHRMGGRMICRRKGKGPCFVLKGDSRYSAVLGAGTCFAVCPSDTATALAALDARVRVTGPRGDRSVPVRDLYGSHGITLEPGELVTEVLVPAPPEGARQGYLKFTEREPVDFAVASVAAVVLVVDGRCAGASIVLGGVAPFPYRARAAEERLEGRLLGPEDAREAAEAALREARPRGMNRYKVTVARELVRRALKGDG